MGIRGASGLKGDSGDRLVGLDDSWPSGPGGDSAMENGTGGHCFLSSLVSWMCIAEGFSTTYFSDVVLALSIDDGS